MIDAREALEHFIDVARSETAEFVYDIDYERLSLAAELISSCEANGGRPHVSGIGKPAHIAGYAASLFSSTGTPCYFLHGTEAVHGSCGQLMEGDVVIFISNSGETAEMKSTVSAVINNGCKVIGITAKPESWLAKHSDVCLTAGVPEEGGPLNRAPRMSIIVETLMLQALSVVLQAKKDITPEWYVKRHPAGALGKLRDEEKQGA